MTDQPQASRNLRSTRSGCAKSIWRSATSGCVPTATTSICGSRGSSRTISTIPIRRSRRARRKPITSPSPSSAAALPGSLPRRGCRKPASRTSGSSRRAATSAAPGTGTGIPARNATRPRWSICRCSKRPATCRRKNTRMRRRSSRTASASASNTASTPTRCSTPRSSVSIGTRRNRAGSSAPTAAMPSPRSSSAWGPGRCMCPNCRALLASSRSRGTRSTPAAGITTTPAAIPGAR